MFQILLLAYQLIIISSTQTTINMNSTNNLAEPVRFKLIVTTDVHGCIFPLDFKTGSPAYHSLAQVHTYVSKERNNYKQEVILLDNGDFLEGDPTVYYYNNENKTEQHISAQVMNFMRYDAASVGNHDIEAGHKIYDQLRKDFQFPWLAANAVDVANRKPYFVPYTIIKRQGVRIAIIGLITPAVPTWLPRHLWAGMEFDDMVESATFWVKHVQDHEKPDLIVGLLHSGIDYNYSGQTENSPKNENASVLVAQKVAGFDIILAGHDHKLLIDTIKNCNNEDVLLVDANCMARVVGAVTIDLQRDKQTHKITKTISAEIVEMANYLPDTSFMVKFSKQLATIKQYINRPIGSITKTISSRETFFGDSELTSLIHTIQLDATGAEISFTAPLSFDVTIDSGIVRISDLFKLYRYNNFLSVIQLSGQNIKDYLEFSYNLWFNQMCDSADHLLNFKRLPSGELVQSKYYQSYELANPFFNFDSAAGLIYTVDVSAPAGQRIEIISLADGKPFSMSQNYKVAINSYRVSGGGSHLTRGAGLNVEQMQQSDEEDIQFIHQHIINWFKKHPYTIPAYLGNWTVKPNEWYQKSKELDYRLLFGNKE